MSTVARVAAGLLVLQALLRGWIGYRGFFFLDDFAFTGRAAQHHLSDLHDFLLEPYNSHLMPGAFAQVWVLTRLWPLNFAAVVTVSLVLQACVGIAFYRLLRELFGTRPAILVPFAVFLLTPITLPAFVWWAAALNQLPQQLALITALLWHTRYLRTGRTRFGVYGALAVAAGLLFSEKTLLTVPLVAAYTLLWFADGSALHRLRVAWRAHWRVWLAYLVVAVPYTAYYVLEVPSPGRALANGGDVVQLFGSAFGHALDPGLLGGPWSWQRIGFVGALAAPNWPAVYVSGLVVVCAVAGTIAWYRRAAYGWLLPAGYASAALLLLAFSRATFIGPLIGDEYRYVTDVAAVAVLGATLAVLRPAGSWRTPPFAVEPRSWTTRVVDHHATHELRAALPMARPRTLGVIAVVLFVASATASTLRYDRFWNDNPARPYLTNLRTDLATAPRGLVIYDQEVPGPVAWALLYPYNRLSNLLRPLPGRREFLALGRPVERLAVVDDSGHLRRAEAVGQSALPGPMTNGCGWLLGARPVRIPLSGTPFPWTWLLRMGYIASADTTATITAGLTTAQVQLQRGPHDVFLEVTGAIDSVRISALTGGATACTAELGVGRATAIPGTIP
jgi:hypothetical protein